ncbi:hypothetical protein D3C76_1213220 [compost metagenome]
MAIWIASSRLTFFTGRPSLEAGTSSRAMTGNTVWVEMEMWLSERIAWMRNQVPVMEITAINQIDHKPLRRWKSPQKIRAPCAKRGSLKKPFQKRL